VNLGAAPTVVDSPGSERSGARSFQLSACQKAARMSQLNHEPPPYPTIANAPPPALHASATRPSHPLQLQLHSIRLPGGRARRSVGARCLTCLPLVPGAHAALRVGTGSRPRKRGFAGP
jgi:hypothetical protein